MVVVVMVCTRVCICVCVSVCVCICLHKDVTTYTHTKTTTHVVGTPIRYANNNTPWEIPQQLGVFLHLLSQPLHTALQHPTLLLHQPQLVSHGCHLSHSSLCSLYCCCQRTCQHSDGRIGTSTCCACQPWEGWVGLCSGVGGGAWDGCGGAGGWFIASDPIHAKG